MSINYRYKTGLGRVKVSVRGRAGHKLRCVCGRVGSLFGMVGYRYDRLWAACSWIGQEVFIG